ncbi:NADH-quinone oxidoreductase subunit K [Halomonas sp. ANAO-440]|uniref:NADH-quinone oxidoreductase subunit K n=1 Tax=Halomonas sp. ANAO-440 TaxID=2861360 RepID=UPI001CAA7C43|nr:NADH-quinone oxidoreductase subunit K [Halomonas sp. ANAO-440]MBZ0331309.1 NADH-quinone oxidoreductase subunit K [Halomonas sp. ANAO-440]
MSQFYAVLAALLCGMALIGLFQTEDLLRRILALNVLASAVFLLLVTVARSAEGIDPVPHVMVLTGIVVAVSTTAAALALVIRADEARRRREEES